MEIGPFRVQGDKLVENDGSWNEFANLLFGKASVDRVLITVDQPVGTGFSYVNTDSYIHELPEVSRYDDKYLQDIDGSAVFSIFGAVE
jgi:carboxypeptidase D